MLYSDHTQPERRRPVKKSKYLQNPYDKAVNDSSATKLQKYIASYAWSPSHDQEDVLYSSFKKARCFLLQRSHLCTLQQDQWVSSFVINSWVNCLNWNQPNDKRTRLITPLLNYTVLEGPDVDNKSKSVACDNFVKRLSLFKYIEILDIDPKGLEYIMTPVLVGDPGYHYVCFVVNIKNQKFEFLNSLVGVGERLHTENQAPTVYKRMFDIWLNEVRAFVEGLYRHRKIEMPFKFSKFKWEIPIVPSQPDKDSCGVSFA
ncbi:unnamed protein product [Trifolium pratense]|uniref:Uncharacterized protein n=1 Tax=Trifolium pratense TaxID=57577 RepID=A0ACB0K384_TRIPR|nr:unnamed protein product [Trifolium pratense]